MLLEQLGEQFPVDEYYARMTARFVELSRTELRLKSGVVELLDLLDDLELPRCIATSSSHATVREHLSAHSLAHRFHAVVGHGDYRNSKPAPDPFSLAAERMGIPMSECLALEDSYSGVRSAAAAGSMTIMAPDLVLPTPEIRTLCCCVVDSLHDVAVLVARSSSSGSA